MVKQDMNEKMETTANDSGRKIYEIGYHIVPIVAEEQVASEVGAIKGLIESTGGLFISDEFPKLRPLAYNISKTIEGHKHDFTEAYFGWVKFEVDPEALPAITKGLESDMNVLRFILVQTVRENTMSKIMPSYRKDGEREDGEEAPAEQPKEITAEDEAKISQSIDELVKE